MNSSRTTALKVTQGAVIAALYVALTLIFAPISFGEMQVRISEALTILPLFTPAAIPGLFLGCVLGNLLGGAIPLDVICGSLATLSARWADICCEKTGGWCPCLRSCPMPSSCPSCSGTATGCPCPSPS